LSLFQIDEGPWSSEARSPSFYLAEELMRQGRRFRYYTPERSSLTDHARQASLPVVALKGKGQKAAFRKWRLSQAMKRHGCRLVHTHDVRFLPVVTAAAARAKVPLQVVTWESSENVSAQALFRSGVIREVDLVIVRKEQDKAALLDQDVDENKIKLIPTGREFPSVFPEAERYRLHREFNLTDQVFLVGVKGRFSESATWSLLGRLNKTLAASAGDGHRLVLLGTEGFSLGARRAHILDNMLFYLGESEPPPQALASLGLFLALDAGPEDKDFLRSLMAAEVPVLAMGKRGLPAELKHEKTGFRVPPDRPSTLVKCVGKAYKDRELGRRLAQHAREVVLNRHSCAAMARRLIQEYERLARQKGLALV
jgi:glycosyltransferase involved in cell wall biosynthesis